ncbi:MAG: CHAD domain-containing protein, partial [Chloroflexi bacterium]|nr:CHAD domain-containing protein [Chloroflexota bacterium]
MTAENTRPVEVELKYRVGDLAAAERLLSAEQIGPFTGGAGRARSAQYEDRYVDTADGSLGRAGFAVRLRQSGGETIVSVKSLARTAGPGGSVRRQELEGPADRVAPAVDWPASDARSLVLEHAGDAPLVEVVTVRQLRRKRQLKSGQSRVELSLDEVDVVSRGRVVDRFVELEAELKKGDEGELEALGLALDAEPALLRALTSKLEAALAAVDGATGNEPLASEFVTSPTVIADTPTPRASAEPAAPRLVVGKTAGVTGDDHIAEAGRKVLRFHLARMLDHEPGVRAGIEAEAVHKMRVATRRQRAAWRVFGEAFRNGRTKRYRDGLRDTARRLGAVRDIDVQLEAADAYRADMPVAEQRALEPLLAAWRAHRDDARVLLLRELDSPSFRRWVDDYIDFARTEGAAVLPVGAVQPHRVRDTAPSRIWSAYEQVRGYE